MTNRSKLRRTGMHFFRERHAPGKAALSAGTDDTLYNSCAKRVPSGRPRAEAEMTLRHAGKLFSYPMFV